MLVFVQNGETERLEGYLQNLNEDPNSVDQVLKTGNVGWRMLFLNSKLSLAGARKIAVNAKARVPEHMAVSDVNLCSILGNLLDNAIESCMRIEEPEKRFPRVYIGVMKQQLYISVTNSAGDNLKKREAVSFPKSGRDEQARFGFGLMRIDGIVKQNGGYVNRQTEEGVFATEVMLPLLKPGAVYKNYGLFIKPFVHEGSTACARFFILPGENAILIPDIKRETGW